MKFIISPRVLILSFFIFFALSTIYGQDDEVEKIEESPTNNIRQPIYKDTPPYKFKLNSFPTNKFKSFMSGYGVIIWTFKSEAIKEKEKTEAVITSHGISIGFKAIENFYNSKIPIEVGMFYSTNMFIGLAASSISKEDAKQKQYFFKENQAVKHIATNFSIGPHISIPNDYITTQLGLGISTGFLFHHLFYKPNKFYLTVGIGPSLDLEFLFRFSQLIGISLAFQVTYYPLLFDSLYDTIKYNSSGLFLSTIQLGFLVISY